MTGIATKLNSYSSFLFGLVHRSVICKYVTKNSQKNFTQLKVGEGWQSLNFSQLSFRFDGKIPYPLILAEVFTKKWFAKITLGAFTHNNINLTIQNIKSEFRVVADTNLFQKLNIALEAQQFN